MRQVVVAGVALTLLAAGCGKNNDTVKSAPVALSGTVNNHGSKDLKIGALELEQDDFYFAPTFVKASPGTAIQVELKNEGTVPHNFSIDGMGIDQTVQPNGSITVSVTTPASGALAFYCKFHKG